MHLVESWSPTRRPVRCLPVGSHGHIHHHRTPTDAAAAAAQGWTKDCVFGGRPAGFGILTIPMHVCAHADLPINKRNTHTMYVCEHKITTR